MRKSSAIRGVAVRSCGWRSACDGNVFIERASVRLYGVLGTQYKSTEPNSVTSSLIMPTLKPNSLEAFAAQLLQAGGTSAEEARLVAASLVDANLKGYD